MTRRVALTPRCGDYAVNCIKTYINSMRALSALAVCIKRAYRTFRTTRLKFIWLFRVAQLPRNRYKKLIIIRRESSCSKFSFVLDADMRFEEKKKTLRFRFACTLTEKFAKRKLIRFIKWAVGNVPLYKRKREKAALGISQSNANYDAEFITLPSEAVLIRAIYRGVISRIVRLFVWWT